MKKQRIEIEYPLAARAPGIIWSLISTDHGLERWLADRVEEHDGQMTFTWGKPWGENDVKTSTIVARVKHSHIRLRWQGDDDEDAYWEMRIARSEITGHWCLFVTDFADEDDVDALNDLWDANLVRLHESSGL